MKIHTSTHPLVCWLFTAASLVLLTVTTARANNYQSTVLADNPLAFYALNPDADGTNTAPDLTGNGNNGTDTNVVAAIGPTPFITNAAYFNGAAQIDLSQGSNPNLLTFTGPITLEGWAQPSSSSLFGDILAKGYDSSTYDEITIRVNGIYGSPGPNYYGTSGSAGVNGGSQTTDWTYIVLSSDGTNCTLYQNGAVVGQNTDTSGSISFGDHWVIGNGSSAGNTRFFSGNISEVAIYAHGLTAAQIVNHLCEGLFNTNAAASIPVISFQPQSTPSYVGGSATFSVTAVSTLSMTYQWYKGATQLLGKTNATLTLVNLALTNAGNYSVVVGNANGSTNSASATLTVSTPRNLQWSVNATNNVWDTANAANWINLANSQETVFDPGDQVLFDDTPGVQTAVTVSGSVLPSVTVVDSTNNTFSFSGPGNLAGSGLLLKEGPSTLNLTTPSGFAGTVNIGGGSLYAGNNCFRNVGSVVVSNNATLDFGGGTFNSVTPITVAGTGSAGQGALINSYADYPGELINATMTGDTLFAGSARWDLGNGSQISGAYNLTVDWSGSGGYGQWNGVTIGANVPQVYINNGSTLGLTSMDTGCQNTSTLFNFINGGQLVLYSGGFNGSLSLNNGAQVIVYNSNVNLAGSTLHLYGGSIMYLYAPGINLTGNNLIFEDGASLQTYYNSGTNLINNQVTLNGVAHWVLGDHYEVFTNVVSGVGGFVLDYYNHAVVFSSSNTYTGPTIIGSDGNSPELALTGNGSISQSSLIFFGGSNPTVPHIDVSGRSDQTLTLASGQTLAGVGGVNGNLVVSSGATVSPSGNTSAIGINSSSTNAVGGIAASGNVNLDGTTALKLDGSATNDFVEAGGELTYGGSLVLTNISGSPLAAGNTFLLFRAANYNGTFTSITPATPGAGLAWSNRLGSGIITVVNASGPVIASAKVSGGNLILTGTGGSSNATYYVLASTNLTGPWNPIATNTYDGSGNFAVTNAISPGVPHQFYRTGSLP